MEHHEVYKGQRVRHVHKGFTGTVVHLVDSGVLGIEVDEQYIERLSGNTNYHHGLYWAAEFNLEPIIKPQQIYYLVSPMFVQVDA